MKRKVSEIPVVPYGNTINGAQYLCEPSDDDIREAVENKEFELRGFQTHEKALKSEWMKALSDHGPEHSSCSAKNYHPRRIAYFVVHGWEEPIELNTTGQIVDGLHRLKAAKYLGLQEVDVRIV